MAKNKIFEVLSQHSNVVVKGLCRITGSLSQDTTDSLQMLPGSIWNHIFRTTMVQVPPDPTLNMYAEVNPQIP
jgi:hypothetical protein